MPILASALFPGLTDSEHSLCVISTLLGMYLFFMTSPFPQNLQRTDRESVKMQLSGMPVDSLITNRVCYNGINIIKVLDL